MQTARATIVCSHEDRSAERPRYIWGIFLISTCTLALTCSNFHFCKIWLALLAINSALWRGGEVRLKQKKNTSKDEDLQNLFRKNFFKSIQGYARNLRKGKYRLKCSWQWKHRLNSKSYFWQWNVAVSESIFQRESLVTSSAGGLAPKPIKWGHTKFLRPRGLH